MRVAGRVGSAVGVLLGAAGVVAGVLTGRLLLVVLSGLVVVGCLSGLFWLVRGPGGPGRRARAAVVAVGVVFYLGVLVLGIAELVGAAGRSGPSRTAALVVGTLLCAGSVVVLSVVAHGAVRRRRSPVRSDSAGDG